MRSQDIEIGERYAWYPGDWVTEIGQVKVLAKGSTPGTVDVEVIHPEDQRPTDSGDYRTVETKNLLGAWHSRPGNTNASRHVLSDDAGKKLTFAESHDLVYARVQTQRELAERLRAVGIDYPRVAWLGRGGSRHYDSERTRQISLSPDEAAQLLFLAERTQPEVVGYVSLHLHDDGQIGSGQFPVPASEKDQAVRHAADHSSPNFPFEVFKVVR